MKPNRIWVFVLVVVSVAGCVQYPANEAIKKPYDALGGYRFCNALADDHADDLLIILAFSGGGTRSAAFSYGILKALRDTINPSTHQPLLNDVDAIYSVSGGSFTAAYYGLYGNRIFDDFESRFLTKNFQGNLILRLFYPWNWWRLASPYWSRIDMTAEYFDNELFDHKTFADLRKNRPFVILNSTDMSLETRFEFTQDQFDLLGSDISTFHIARAVAASSAFPVLLCPLTLNNYPKPAGYAEPVWVGNVMGDQFDNQKRFQHASNTRSYLAVDSKTQQPDRPFIHLIDGGLSDNLGLRGPIQSMQFLDKLSLHSLSVLQLINNQKIKRLVVITANAKPGTGTGRDHSASTPGLVDVITTSASSPMDNFTGDTENLIEYAVKQMNRNSQHPVDENICYSIEVDFQGLGDPAEREHLESLGTNYDLPAADVHELEGAAAEALNNSQDFKRLLKDLGNSVATTAPSTKP